MKTYTFLALTFLALILASADSRVHAQGPGLGNISYNSSELFKRISVIKSPKGHGNVAMVNGYLMVIYSSDGGGTSRDGGIEFWDVSNPRKPVLAVRHDNRNTHGLREAHGFAFSSSYPGDYMVAQAVEGIQFWDLSDPFNISLLDYMRLPVISQGDYSGAWWVFWQAPYVYVAGMGSGLYVIDAADPANPVLLNRVQTSQIGGLNPGMVYALGNLLLVAENQSGFYATMDISDPANPKLIEYFDGKSGYSHIFAAAKFCPRAGMETPAGCTSTTYPTMGTFLLWEALGLAWAMVDMALTRMVFSIPGFPASTPSSTSPA
jgi:hypothetical protein